MYCFGTDGDSTFEASWTKNKIKIQALGCPECLDDPDAEPYYDLVITKSQEDNCGEVCESLIFESAFAEYGFAGESLFSAGFNTYIEFFDSSKREKAVLHYFENIFDKKTQEMACRRLSKT